MPKVRVARCAGSHWPLNPHPWNKPCFPKWGDGANLLSALHSQSGIMGNDFYIYSWSIWTWPIWWMWPSFRIFFSVVTSWSIMTYKCGKKNDSLCARPRNSGGDLMPCRWIREIFFLFFFSNVALKLFPPLLTAAAGKESYLAHSKNSGISKSILKLYQPFEW